MKRVVAVLLASIIMCTPIFNVYANEVATVESTENEAGEALENEWQMLRIVKFEPSDDMDDMYVKNALQVVSLVYAPSENDSEIEAVADAFLFSKKEWTAIKEGKDFSNRYVVIQETEKFVYVIKMSNITPYKKSSDTALTVTLAMAVEALNPGNVEVKTGLYGATFSLDLSTLENIVAARLFTLTDAGETETICFYYEGNERTAPIASISSYKNSEFKGGAGEKLTSINGYTYLLNVERSSLIDSSEKIEYALYNRTKKSFVEAAKNTIYSTRTVDGKATFVADYISLKRTIDIKINGKEVGHAYVSNDNSVLIPISAFEKFGAYYSMWNDDKTEFIVSNGFSIMARVKMSNPEFDTMHYVTLPQVDTAARINDDGFMTAEYTASVFDCEYEYSGNVLHVLLK